MLNDEEGKWVLAMSYNSGPGRTVYPLREPYGSEAAARRAYRGYAATAASMGGTVVYAEIYPPKGKGNKITLVRS